MIAISASSWATRSSRPPFLYRSTDSCRCLIIFCKIASTSASPSAGLLAPRASMSAFFSVELTMRSVETVRSFLAFIASLRASLIWSRSTGAILLLEITGKSAEAMLSGPCLHIHNTQLRAHDPDASESGRGLGGTQGHGAPRAGRRNGAGGFWARRDRPCGRRSLLQHRDDRL